MATASGQWDGLMESMGRLSLLEKTAIQLDTSKSTYIVQMAVQPGEDPLVAAATSTYNIHVLSRNYLTSKGVLSGHTKQITGVAFGKSECHCLFSSSADRTVRCWDSRSSGKKEVQKFEAPENVHAEILCVDCNESDRLLCVGTEAVNKDDTYILFWDRRMGSLLGSYTDSHDNDVNQVRFKPDSENILASGSSDGLLCTFDLNETNEDDALQMTFNADSDVERIGWCGKNFDDLYCVTTDSMFHVWDSVEGDDRCDLSGPASISTLGREPVEYVVDCIPEYTAQDRNQSEALLVTGTYGGCLSLVGISSDGESQLIKSLPGGHSSTVRCSHWLEQTKTLLTAGEDAFLCLWSVTASDLTPSRNNQKSNQAVKRGRKSQDSKKPYSKQKGNHAMPSEN